MKVSHFACVAAMALCPAVALAGPCSDDIANLGKQLSQMPGMGATTTGAVSGATPGTVSTGSTPSADTKGTSADQRVGGTAGTKEADAASANVATSDADVRRQQEGKPTVAQASGTGGTETSRGGSGSATAASDDRVTRAKAAWQKAVDLNAQNDDKCHGAVDDARTALKAS